MLNFGILYLRLITDRSIASYQLTRIFLVDPSRGQVGHPFSIVTLKLVKRSLHKSNLIKLFTQ